MVELKTLKLSAAQWRAVAREAENLAAIIDHHCQPWFQGCLIRPGTPGRLRVYGVDMFTAAGLNHQADEQRLSDYDLKLRRTYGLETERLKDEGRDVKPRYVCHNEERHRFIQSVNREAAEKMQLLHDDAAILADCPEPSSQPKRRSGSWIPAAEAMLRHDPNISDGRIAELLKLHRSTVRRNRKWQAERARIEKQNRDCIRVQQVTDEFAFDAGLGVRKA